MKLGLDKKQVARIRKMAASIASELQSYINAHTTVTVERATARMMGVDGVDAHGYPLPNVIVDHLGDNVSRGVAYHLANAVLATGKPVNDIASDVAQKKIDLLKLKEFPESAVKKCATVLIKPQFTKIAKQRAMRASKLIPRAKRNDPWLYLIVATGNIYEDVRQARAAAREGAEIIAVIRTTAQSLLDYVPYGPTTEGFGGTYATQANFSIMRAALDEVGAELGRYIQLVNYASGLCMPEIVVMGSLERLDMMLNDSMYGILFRDINMYRTFVDQNFSRMLNSFAGIIINTGEDNYLTTADAIEEGHTVLASDFINEQFAKNAGLPPSLMGLGHAFEIDPSVENSLLLEIAQALLVRECFPAAPIKYMPPTKHMTGDIFRGYVLNTMFNIMSQLTGQGVHLLGMLTEALHTPHLQDRYLALENAKYVFNASRGLAKDIALTKNGFIMKRARHVIDETEKFLSKVSKTGLIGAIEKGWFAGIKRRPDGGKGLKGVFAKGEFYFNPVEDELRKALKLKGAR